MDLVDCERRKMRLTRSGCARMFVSAAADRPKAWEGRHACIACQAGAERAGVKIEAHADVAEAWRPVCPRCLRVSDRMIRGDLCVSCDARAGEVRRGRNCKGNMPGLAKRLGDYRISVLAGGRTSERVRVCVSMVEAIIAAGKSPGVVSVGRSAPTFLEAGLAAQQMRMPL